MKKTNADMTDESIVVKVTQEDQEMYAVLVERYQHKLQRYARTLVFDDEKAADVVQQAFIKAFVNLRSFDTKRKFSSWIYRIAHNEAINYIKKHKRELHPDDEDWLLRIPDEETDFGKDFDAGLLREDVASALEQLGPKYRAPVVLFYFEHKSYKEISDILRLPVATIGTRINRAKKQLRVSLEQEKKA